MASRYPKYRMRDGSTFLGASYFNGIFRDVDLRLVDLEGVKAEWDAAVDELRKYGLERLDAALHPVVDQLSADAASVQAAIDALPDVALQSDLADLEVRLGDADALTLSYSGGRLSGMSETLGADTRTTTLAYNPDDTLASVQVDFRGIRRTTTYAYNGDGTLAGSTTQEITL